MLSFWDKFIKIVDTYPDNVSVSENGKTITYRQLAIKAASLGESLIKKGARTEDLVAIEIEKSTEYIVAMLACWYSGTAFVPLPPSLPQARRDYIARNANIIHNISSSDITSLQPVADYSNYYRPTADCLAYVIYTSGSTGNPKGVMVEHKGIVNFLEEQIKIFKTNNQSRYLFYLSILFDAAVSDIGVSLLSGATLVIEPPEVLKDGIKFVAALQDNNITHTDIPPSLLKILQISEMPKTLETIIIGGEICPPATVREWASKYRIINVYGPTEATVCTSMCLCDSIKWDKPLIGNAISGIGYHVFDKDFNEVNEGELYIEGIGLARGYLQQSELTGHKFIVLNSVRFYKTGDKVLRHDNGDIEFLGRIDRQFKLRGQLIEPDEIEAKLISHSLIKKSAVIKKEEKLIAFVQAADDINIDAIIVFLKKYLPLWMIPQHFEVIREIPTTATGKIDYSKLHEIELSPQRKSAIEEPITDIEKKIWNIWVKILGHDNFGIKDDFFNIGGDSLGIIRMTLEMDRLGLSLKIRDLAVNRTIEKIVANINEDEETIDVLPTAWLKHDVAFNEDWLDLFAQAEARSKSDIEYNNIFLTGATGFLGSNILFELLSKTEAIIYCLVRAKDNEDAEVRIVRALGRFGFNLTNEQVTRIKFVCGDITKASFGVEKEVWNNLVNNIDAIYHCAAIVNMILPYSELRATNVEATQEILRMACLGKRKDIHYASTLSVFVATNQNSGVLSETDRLDKVEKVYGGYAQSKWASEFMLLQVPKEACKITHYRFGLITGDTKYGVGSDKDFLNMFVKGISSIGSIPAGIKDNIFVDITPIDYAAKAMVHISLTGNQEIYHIANDKGLALAGLIESINRNRRSIKELSPSRWKELVDNKAITVEETAACMSLCRYSDDEYKKHRIMDLFQATNVNFDCSNTINDLQGSGIICPSITDSLIDLYLRYMSKTYNRIIKICVFGPESTGKSTITEKLAKHYNTSFAAEFAKDLIFSNHGNITYDDIAVIARGQIKNESEASANANRVLFCDTDLVTTSIWSRELFNDCPQWVDDAAELQNFDFYFLMDIDTEWVNDIHRFRPDDRGNFFNKCETSLINNSSKYQILSGSWDEKFKEACRKVDQLISNGS